MYCEYFGADGGDFVGGDFGVVVVLVVVLLVVVVLVVVLLVVVVVVVLMTVVGKRRATTISINITSTTIITNATTKYTIK